ncbi:MAG: GDP-mannose 4,6-dehydratase [Proteobacteria bacterium]|nr:GDP-mannose 4,6-dehydratase [Pseudomonadota bacterium]
MNISANNMSSAMITGANGQDGAWLSLCLLKKQHQVFAVVRETADLFRLDFLKLTSMPNYHLCVIKKQDEIDELIKQVQPNEFYHLAAASFVVDNTETQNRASARWLDRILKLYFENMPEGKFLFASSSEIYPASLELPANENTDFAPATAYGLAKLKAQQTVDNYRDQHGFFCCSVILFNHESELRANHFVTQKICKAAVKISLKKQNCLYLGNINGKKDWGYATEYVEGMHLVLQYNQPINFVLASGELYSVKQLVDIAFAACGINLSWQGSGLKTTATDQTGQIVIAIDPKFYRDNDNRYLQGDASLAKQLLNWQARSSAPQIIKKMIKYQQMRLKENTQ